MKIAEIINKNGYLQDALTFFNDPVALSSYMVDLQSDYEMCVSYGDDDIAEEAYEAMEVISIQLDLLKI